MALDPADFGPGLGYQTTKLETGPKVGGPQTKGTLAPDVDESLRKRRRQQMTSLFGSALRRAVPGTVGK